MKLKPWSEILHDIHQYKSVFWKCFSNQLLNEVIRVLQRSVSTFLWDWRSFFITVLGVEQAAKQRLGTTTNHHNSPRICSKMVLSGEESQVSFGSSFSCKTIDSDFFFFCSCKYSTHASLLVLNWIFFSLLFLMFNYCCLFLLCIYDISWKSKCRLLKIAQKLYFLPIINFPSFPISETIVWALSQLLPFPRKL